MKKFLALMGILLLLLLAILQFILPRTVENILATQITKATAATEVDVSLSSSPNFRIALGEIDRSHATASAGYIGDINFKNLTLDAEKVSLDVLELLFPTKDLSAQLRTQKILQHADNIQLRGVITQDELKNFIAKQDGKFEDPQVSINKDEATATAKVKFLGRTVDLDVAGTFLVNNGSIYFHMTRLNSNSILSRVNIDTFLSDIKILDGAILPLNLKFDSVELREGEAVITAIGAVQ